MDSGKVKLGLIGAGSVREMYGPAFRYINTGYIAAVADPDEKALKKTMEVMNIPRGYNSVQSMLEDVELDAVLIVSPVFLHLEHVIAAAETGLHILLEKPMARTVKEAEKIIEVSKNAGVLLSIAFNRRLIPPIWTAEQIIRSGELGEIFNFECVWRSWTAAYNSGWRDSAECMGGVFQDHGSHTIDTAQRWFGEAETVFAQSHYIGPLIGKDKGVEDHMTAAITHKSGKTSLHIHSRDCMGAPVEFYRIYGSSKTLEMEYYGGWAYTARDNWEIRLYSEEEAVPERLVSRRPGNELLLELPDGHYAFYAELKNFIDTVASKAGSISPSGEEGLSVVKAVCTCYMSAAEGVSLKVEEGRHFEKTKYEKFLNLITRRSNCSQ